MLGWRVWSRVSLRSNGPKSTQASSFSRGEGPPSFAIPPSDQRGSGAPIGAGCLHTLNSGPVMVARDAVASCVLSNARLSALHCGGFRLSDPGQTRCLAARYSRGDPPRAPLVVTAVSEAPRVLLAKQTRRTPVPPCSMRCLAKNTLGGRDDATMPERNLRSSNCPQTGDSVVISFAASVSESVAAAAPSRRSLVLKIFSCWG